MTKTKSQSRVKKYLSENPRTTEITMDPYSYAEQTDRESANSVSYKQEKRGFVAEFDK